MRWLTGFIFHKIAFGTLSIFLPLYISQTVSGGSLLAWGVIAAAATFVTIPFAFLWGYLCDATQRYRFFILTSFAAVTLLLYVFSLTTDLLTLGLIYVLIAVFQVAHEPPKNVLIAETYSHAEWKRSFARYEGWTELGWVIGLLLGFILAASNAGNALMLLVSVLLSLISFIASAILVMDPALIFERGMVSIEKSISLLHRGAVLLSRTDTDVQTLKEFKQENALALCTGLVLFTLATSIFFTPMPVFFATTLALQTSTIFVIFLLNSASCFIGYFITQRRTDGSRGTTTVGRIALLRSVLALLPTIVVALPFAGAVALSTAVLAVMGFVFAFYSVEVLSLSMEVIPQGKAGLFTALAGAGAAIGCFIGPFIAQNMGFQYAFAVSAACFLLSFVAFKRFE